MVATTAAVAGAFGFLLYERKSYAVIEETARGRAENDMQVGGSCSTLPFPMATELAAFHAHHWDLAHPAFRQRRWFNNTYHPFPRTAALTAMVQLAAELSLAYQ